MPKIYYNKKIAADENTIALLHFDDPENPLKDECGNIWCAYSAAAAADSVFSNSPFTIVSSDDNSNFGKVFKSNNPSHTADYLFQLANKAVLDLSGSDWTIDFRVKLVSKAGSSSVTIGGFGGSPGVYVWQDNAGYFQFRNPSGSTAFRTSDYSKITVWGHLAAVYKYSAKTLTVYTNGVKAGAFTNLVLSDFQPSPYFAYGPDIEMNELRISNCARWTENFTPPTEPYELGEHIETKSIELSEVN